MPKPFKPNKPMIENFLKKMEDPEYAKKYHERRLKRMMEDPEFLDKIQGAEYIPSRKQFTFCVDNVDLFQTENEVKAMGHVTYGYSLQQKVHMRYLEIVNFKMTSKGITP